ncbi:MULTISPECIES: molybdate ABC transporter substrate-binding protein [Serratia]|jgi:molybdate transport system substrate-binding protein|uniref:Molybdate ABC transporter substrate-binding protein n=1 Tax=Serratia fonticola TaxID=47917 RepID=A0ABY9PS22_SERFO|nr:MULTISPECIES: molybdate ABC transporter substrate-binding protein [Serratia]ATM74775.1 molybdate ABC transporter substrate-binding protein [Serratia fonticola]MBC3220651.1 molybdate ABC transporter substrate-binding protein [Serratia fonticola]MBE0153395.1 molybdate ABC transporter substrate-binding protein [Serratia fonticola]NBJ36422.1 molybdate ABC transporter substrate-binding protein [Serratia fonticola]NCG51870.1 molybdate ABC transporter substrate-binding protein [Serratia fonticola]
MKQQWINWVGGVALACGLVAQVSAAEKITVFAAASLTNALQDIATEYQKGKDVEVVSSFASSSTLARQIEQGAPADMFISADQQWMDYAIDKQQMVKDTRYTLLGNELVLIAAKAAKQDKITINKQTDWAKLLNGGRLSVGDPDHVPAGIYAKEALQNLGAWTTLEPQLARANNVRSAMAMVEREEAPLGIVYGSDAVASDKVKVIAIFPEDSHKPVEYPMAIVKDHQTPAVTAFYDYLKTPAAAAIFERYGFTPRK